MSDRSARPRSRPGLLVADHLKRGQRFVTVLDRSRERVCLLEPWEHAVLVLSDGTRSVESIARVLGETPLPGGSVSLALAEVVRCLRFLEQEGLLESMSDWGAARATEPPGPRTLAGLQEAYREWHADPVRTGRILTGQHPEPFPAPLPERGGPPPRRWVGETIVVGADGRPAEPESLEVAELLRVIDDDLYAFGPTEGVAPSDPLATPRAHGGESELPAERGEADSDDHRFEEATQVLPGRTPSDPGES